MFLLDTNVISGLRRPSKADRNVATWAGAIPAASFFLSAISILEIELGALLIARRDATQGAVLRAWIDDQILVRFDARILAVDTIVAQRCARQYDAKERGHDRRHDRDVADQRGKRNAERIHHLHVHRRGWLQRTQLRDVARVC